MANRAALTSEASGGISLGNTEETSILPVDG
jgi:hypothetical protein